MQGKVNLPLLAHMIAELKAGGRNWVRQFENGFPLVGSIQEPRVYPARQRPDPELSPEQLLVSSIWRLKARRVNVTDPNGEASREDAMGQVEKGWLSGPHGFDEEGGHVTTEGSQLANPAFRFGA